METLKIGRIEIVLEVFLIEGEGFLVEVFSDGGGAGGVGGVGAKGGFDGSATLFAEFLAA